jgi:hypothetical protein
MHRPIKLEGRGMVAGLHNAPWSSLRLLNSWVGRRAVNCMLWSIY